MASEKAWRFDLKESARCGVSFRRAACLSGWCLCQKAGHRWEWVAEDDITHLTFDTIEPVCAHSGKLVKLDASGRSSMGKTPRRRVPLTFFRRHTGPRYVKVLRFGGREEGMEHYAQEKVRHLSAQVPVGQVPRILGYIPVIDTRRGI